MANAKPTKVNGYVEEATGKTVNSTVDAKGNPVEVQAKSTKTQKQEPKKTIQVNTGMVRKDF